MCEQADVEVFVGCLEDPDGGSWEQFHARFDPQVRAGVARVMARLDQRLRRDELDDLVQDVYCRLLERSREYRLSFRGRTVGEVLRYLQRVCESVVVDVLRARRSMKRGGEFELLQLDSRPDVGANMVRDPSPTPEARCLVRDLRRVVLDCCRRSFGEANRERNLAIFEMAVLEGWTSREIAEGTDWGLKAGSIDSLVHRQRRRLRAEGYEVPLRL